MRNQRFWKTATIILFCGVLRAEITSLNLIESIKVQDEPNETVVIITTQKTPTFSVFRLDDPIRLFLDFSQGDISKVSEQIVVENGVIDQIGTLAFKSKGVQIGRVIIGLEENSPYDIYTEGNSVIIRIDASKRRVRNDASNEMVQRLMDVREQLLREEENLAKLRAAKEEIERLMAGEEIGRKEAERLRQEAESLKEKAIAEAKSASQTAKEMESRLKEIERMAKVLDEQRKSLEIARQREAERLSLLRSETENALREKEIAIKSLEAEKAKKEALEKLTKELQAKKALEEEALIKAEQAKRMVEESLKLEQERLNAVRAAREAEEAKKEAIARLANQEKENLRLAQEARKQEEKILAEITRAKQAENEALRKAEETKGKKEAEEVQRLRNRVAELEKTLEELRSKSAKESAERLLALDIEGKKVKELEALASNLRAEANKLEIKVKEAQSERDRLMAEANKIQEDITKARELATKAEMEVKEKEKYLKEVEIAREEANAKRMEIQRLEKELKAQELEYKRIAQQAQAEALRLSAIETEQDQAMKAYRDMVKKIAEENQRLAEVAAQRTAMEAELSALKAELEDLKNKRKEIETEEARKLRQALEAKEAEIAQIKQYLKKERERADKTVSEVESQLMHDLMVKEQEIAVLKEKYEKALLEHKQEVKKKDEDISRLEAEMKKAKNEVETLRETLAQRERELLETRLALEAEKQGRRDRSEIERLEKSVKEKEMQLQSVQKELKDSIEKANALVAERNVAIAKLQEEIERLKNNPSETPLVKEMKQNLETKEMELTVLKKAYEEARKKLSKSEDAERKITELKKALDKHQRETELLRKRLQEELELAKKELQDREQKISILTKEIESVKAQASQKENQEVVKLRGELQKKEEEVLALYAKLEEAKRVGDSKIKRETQEKITEIEGKMAKIKKEMEAAKAREREASDREAKAMERITILMEELRKKERGIEEAIITAEKAKMRAEEAERRAQEVKAKAEEEIVRARERAIALEEKLAKSEKEIEKLSNMLKAAKSEGVEGAKMVSALTETLKSTINERDALKNEINLMREKAKKMEMEIENLKKMGAEGVSTLEKLASELEKERKAREKAEQMVQETQQNYQRRLFESLQEIEKRQKEIQRLESELENQKVSGSAVAKKLHEELEKERKQRDKLAQEILLLHAQIAEINEKTSKKILEVEMEKESLKLRSLSLENKLKTQEAEVERLSKALKERERNSPQDEKAIKALREELAKGKAERDRLMEELAEARREVEKTRRETNALASGLEAKLKAQEAEVERLSKALKERERNSPQDEKAIKALREELAKGKAERDRLMEELAEARREVEKTRRETNALASGLETKLKAQEAEVERLSKALKERERNSPQDEKAIKALREELAKEKEERDRLTKEIVELKTKIERNKPEQNAKHIVNAVDFREIQGLPAVEILLDEIPQYSISGDGKTYTLVLKNSFVPPKLQRRMDVSAFESAVNMITTYPSNNGEVKIVAELNQPSGQSLQIKGNKLIWTFGGPPPERMVAAAVPTPQTGGGQAGSPQPATPTVPTMAPPPEQEGQTYLRPSLVPKKKKYRGRHVNLTVKDAEIQDVLTFLAREGKVNIVTSEDVRGKVTFHLEDVPWDLALDTVLKAKGLDYVIEQGIYRVAPIEQIQREYEAQIEKLKRQRELKPVVVRLIPLNYAESSELISRLKTVLSPQGQAEMDARTNTLILKDTEDYLTAAEELVKRLDQQTPQILIEARIVEARTTFKEDIGIQWGGRFAMASVFGNETGLVFPSSIGIAGGADDPMAPKMGINLETPNFAVNLPAAVGAGSGGALGIQLGSIGGAANLSLRLSAAEENGDVKIISSPRISTLDNRRATISQGVSIPISVVSAAGVNTQFFSADLKLEVTPHVTRDNHISLKLDITKNEPDFGNVAANGNPTIQRKEAHTELLVRDGDTTVIGGIYTRSTSKSYKKVPLLGSIPILGWFFKSRMERDDRSELLIFITPKVVNREVAL